MFLFLSRLENAETEKESIQKKIQNDALKPDHLVQEYTKLQNRYSIVNTYMYLGTAIVSFCFVGYVSTDFWWGSWAAEVSQKL